MPKFKKEKKVIRKQVGGGFDVFQAAQDIAERFPTGAIKAALMQVPGQTAGAARMASNIARYLSPTVAGELLGQGALGLTAGMLGSPGRERASAMGAGLSQRLPKVPSGIAVPGQQMEDVEVEPQKKPSAPSGGRKQPGASRQPAASRATQGRAASMADFGLAAPGGVSPGISGMLSGATSAAAPSRNAMYDYDTASSPASLKEMSAIFKQAAKAPGTPADMAKAAGEIPKTKAGLKKFMQEYGKFIALGAMAGQGGKGGQIAAPIMAALPGLIEMMKGKKKGESMKKADGGSIKDSKKNLLEKARTGDTDDSKLAKFIEKRSYTLEPGPRRSSTFLDALFAPRVPDLKDVPYYKDKYPKSSGGEPPKKSEGGAIRKFKGGSMKGNTKDNMLTPKYKKGGATGEMPQHKKMAMGKPTPQSMKQKFAKGGTMKCASGGVPKGYGISKKIRPTGPMN